MAQCTVTGKMVPEDELVAIQGHRVCAEGKAILLDRLKSGESLPDERVKPSVWRRFCCIFVDGLIIGVPFAILSAIVNRGHDGYVIAGSISLLTTVVQIVYFGQMHASSGQTVGKKAGKLVVVNVDGSPITTGTAYVRALAYCGPGLLSGLATLAGIPALLVGATLVVSAWGLIDVIMALVDRQMQRSLHDRIAGTRVVEKN
jgi:uncharacterized RDD family membrane protein YckC